MSLLRKLSLMLRRSRFHNELDEEMAFHRQQAEQDLIRDGMSPQAARQATSRSFGNPLKLREQSHEVVAFRWETASQDVSFAVRQMLRSPGFTVALVLTLALGIGATTAIFSAVHATLLRPLPYPQAQRILTIEDVRVKGVSTGGLVTVPRFYDLLARSRSFASLASFYFEHPTMIYGTRLPEQLEGVAVTGQFWRVMGVQPLLGRVFDEREDQPHTSEVIVLSYAAWQRLFGGDPSVVGKAVTIDRNTATIIGVMPQSFNFPSKMDLWRPTHFDPRQWNSYRGDAVRFVNLAARLKPQATLVQGQTELQLIGTQLGAEHPDTDALWRFKATLLREFLSGELKPALLVLLAASAVLLLIACLNVANLLLSRATSRHREIAMRQALGASRIRIVRQLLTESLCISLCGGIAGTAAAFLLLRVTGKLMPQELLGTASSMLMDWPVLGFALGLSLAAGLLFGLAPITFVRSDLHRGLKVGERVGGTAGSGLRNLFIAAQVGLSLVLLVTAGLLVQSFWKLTRSPFGFEPHRVLTFSIQLPWGSQPGKLESFFAEVQRRLESLPAVAAVGQASALPTQRWHSRLNYDLDWKPRTPRQDTANVESRSIGGKYFDAMRIPLLAGRELRAHDDGVVAVNQAFVNRFLPGGNPVGRHLLYGDHVSVQIVGVVGNVRGTGGSLTEEVEPEIYFSNEVGNNRVFVVRTQGSPEQLIAAIREQVHQVDPAQAIGNFRTLDDMLSTAVARPQMNMTLLAAFAAIALVLACVGIYGVTAYSIARRRQEIGIRMALGARRAQIALLFLRRALLSTALGLAGGTIAALLLTRLLRSQLYGVEPDNPLIYIVATLLLLLPVLLASLRPALQAASVDPVVALRTE